MRRPVLFSLLPGYSRADLTADLIAGATVAMVALPLSLAIAIASGAPPGTGLVTAVVAGFLISFLGGSRVQIGGPTGAFIVVVFGVIAEHGYDGLVIATLMAGCILLVAGWLHAGRLIVYIPEAVMNGFTIGIALIIASTQVKDALGLDAEGLPADFIEKIPRLWDARDSVTTDAVIVAVATGAMIVALRRAAPRFPGLIFAVAAGSALAFWLSADIETIGSRFGALPDSLPWPSAPPELGWSRLVELAPSAILIAFLAGIESLLSAMVADRMTGDHHRPNAELTAQGAANIASALFGGLPATGAIARTATNIRAGGRTPVAGMVHAAAVLVMMMAAAPLAERIALPALAALLILVAWNMSEPHRWAEYARGRRSDFALTLLTFALTVLVDLTVAISVGCVIGLALRLHRGPEPAGKWSPPDR